MIEECLGCDKDRTVQAVGVRVGGSRVSRCRILPLAEVLSTLLIGPCRALLVFGLLVASKLDTFLLCQSRRLIGGQIDCIQLLLGLVA